MAYKRVKRHNPRPPVQLIRADRLETMLHGESLTTRPLSAGAIEARRLLAIAKQTYIPNQKEIQMPDLKTELNKVINGWEKETNMNAKHAIQDVPASTEYKKDGRTTTGVSQATFDYVKRNPGKTKAVAIQELEQQGYKPTSTTTLLSSMIRQGHMTLDTNGGLHAAIEHYTPVKYVPSKTPAKPVKVSKPAPVQAKEESPQGLAALYVQPTPAPVQTWTTAPTPALEPTHLTAQQVLSTLNVKEAYELYLALAKMFA